MAWDSIFNSLSASEDLSSDQITWAMGQILEGKASNDQIKQFLLGLKTKGESAKRSKPLSHKCIPIAPQ